MKKIVGLMVGAAFLSCLSGLSGKNWSAKAENNIFYVENCVKAQENQDDLQLKGKSAYLVNYQTGVQMYAQNERARLPIASMCKIMTLLLSFEALEEGVIALDEEICVSERAASMGGSQVFLEANSKYPVKELIKSIVVCSANDSCVAMAERIAGSEALFVEIMNAKAKELGANDTLFANCTGLPKEPQYSCAKDVATMLKALLSHESYFEFGKVWMDKFQHPTGRYTEITNTNKLVRFYEGCDGGKTGFTNEAGFCLAATAKRGEMRVISVVIGEETSANRFDDVRTMFDYAFANYSMAPIVEAGVPLEQKAPVRSGKEEKVSIYAEKSVYSFTKRGEKSNFSTQIDLKSLKAPLKKGETAGELLVFKDGVEIDRVKLLAAESVEKAGFVDNFKEIAGEWNR